MSADHTLPLLRSRQKTGQQNSGRYGQVQGSRYNVRAAIQSDPGRKLSDLGRLLIWAGERKLEKKALTQ